MTGVEKLAETGRFFLTFVKYSILCMFKMI